MLVELIMFGGLFFWIVFGLAMLGMLSTTDSEDGGSIAIFITSLVVFFGFSKPPAVFFDWRLLVSYFVIGAIWWFFVFNIRLLKLKRYLREDPKRVVDGIIVERELHGDMRQIYNDEPSFEKFFSRCFCWPLNMLKFLFKDFLEEAWRIISNFAVLYKNKLLGAK